jgi:LysM repeat protein
MRLRILLPLATSFALAAPAAASAAFAHTVAAGESLYSVAAADGVSVDQLAAANGLSVDSQIRAGSTLMIPPQGSASSPVAAAVTPTAAVPAGDGDGDSDDPGAPATDASTAPSSASPGVAGSYVVAPGDTLSAIAARAGVSVGELAAANGLDPNGTLLAGDTLQLAGGSSTTVPVSTSTSTATAESQPVGSVAQGSASSPPYPTPERVTASQIGQIASANGVSPSLAAAIGWQESGFNNDLVSSADARGVMQILPGTWDWINRTLTAGTPLAPASASENVRGGVLLLHSLLSATGGDPAMAAAGYYQGLPSVQQHGLYSDTQNYVNSVMALRQQFGGG